jgi:hypothetical protein
MGVKGINSKRDRNKHLLRTSHKRQKRLLYLFHEQQPLVGQGQGLLVNETKRSHSVTPLDE